MNTDACTAERHEMKKLDDAVWAALPLIGIAVGLEWRNCPRCESTLCRKVQS